MRLLHSVPCRANDESRCNSGGQVIKLIDPQSNQTTWNYDAVDEVVITDRLGNVSKQRFDSAGELIRTTDRDGDTRAFVPDALGRVITETMVATLTSGRTHSNTISYKYDSQGRVSNPNDRNAKVTLQYDNADQAASIQGIAFSSKAKRRPASLAD